MFLAPILIGGLLWAVNTVLSGMESSLEEEEDFFFSPNVYQENPDSVDDPYRPALTVLSLEVTTSP